MPLLMIRCPRTSRPLPTNRILSPEAFARVATLGGTIGPCPHCKGQHAWTREDAYLVGTTPPPRRARPVRAIPAPVEPLAAD